VLERRRREVIEKPSSYNIKTEKDVFPKMRKRIIIKNKKIKK
jgi:hypothetical protein